MKTCNKCGLVNLVDTEVNIKFATCENCGDKLFKSEGKFNPVGDGNTETKRKMMHDEMPWDFGN